MNPLQKKQYDIGKNDARCAQPEGTRPSIEHALLANPRAQSIDLSDLAPITAPWRPWVQSLVPTEPLASMIETINRFPHITTLACMDRPVNAPSLNLLLQNKNIHTINLRHVDLSKDAYKALVRLIESPCLQRLNIQSTTIQGYGGFHIFEQMADWGRAALQSQTLTDFKILTDEQITFLHSNDEELDDEEKEIRNRYKPLFEQVQAHVAQNRHRQRQWQREAVVLSSLRANLTHPFKFSILPLVPQIMALASDNPYPLNKKRKREEAESK